MTDHLDALICLAKAGTMAAAATRLRVTASAMSKRIAHLEDQLGFRLVEPKGRNVVLTARALELVERVEPILADLRAAFEEGKFSDQSNQASELSIGVTESVLGSWGADLLGQVAQLLPHIHLTIHTHRSPVVLDRVRSGELALGICAGLRADLTDLRSTLLATERMEIVPSELKAFPLRKGQAIPVMTIESHALTWLSLRAQIRELANQRDVQIKVEKQLQSFAAIVQLAKAGFGHGLVPRGIALALGVSERQLVRLPSPGLQRPVSLIGRPSTFARGVVVAFCEAIAEQGRQMDGPFKWET